MSWPLVAGVAILVLGVLVGVYAVFIEPFDLRVTTLEFPIADLDPAFDGYTISVLADIHQAPWTPIAYLRRAVDESNRADPDLVALLGDYGASFETMKGWSRRLYAAVLPKMVPVMRGLKHRDGLVGVIGNHDHWGDDQRVRAWLGEIGATLLENACMAIRRPGAGGSAMLLLGGVADAEEGSHVDPSGGCSGGPPGVPTIVLSHHPDGVLDFDTSRRIDLILAGHTHGGQVVIPFYGAPITVSKVCGRKTASGWVPNRIAPLYVSRGIGTQTPPRFGAPPELVIIKLRSLIADR